MGTSRIKDLTEATTAQADDYFVIDGPTLGTRKISATEIGGDVEYDIGYSTTISVICSNAVNMYGFKITPDSTEDLSIENVMKIKAYHRIDGKSAGDYTMYPLIISSISYMPSNGYITCYLKSVYGNLTYGSATNFASGYVHFILPFSATISPNM